MAINTYSTLNTAIANWLDRTDLTDRIPEFITLAEARIARKLRSRANEARDTTISTVSGTEYYDLPDGFLEARNVQINTDPVNVLKYRTPEQMDFEYSSGASGAPKVFTIIGTQIQLKPIPDSANTLEIAYLKRFDALSTSNETNWLITDAPDLLLYGALIEAESFLMDDKRIMTWKAQYEESMADWNILEDRGRHSGSHLEIRTGSSTP